MIENQSSPDFLGDLPGQSAARRGGSPPANTEEEQEQLSKFLVDFKAGAEPQTTQWIRLASLVASHSFSCDIVIRALGPTEQVAKGAAPLDKLGVGIARKTGAKYCPTRLQRSSDGFDSILTEGVDPFPGDHYVFDKSFLPAKCRVLVVGEPDTNPATFDAIKAAVLEALPEAEVKFFTLAWLGEHVRGAHLDGKYFLSHASPVSALHVGDGGESVHPSPARESKPRRGKNGAAKETAKGSGSRKEKPVQKDGSPADTTPKPAGSKRTGRTFYLVAAGVIVLLGIAYVVSRNWTIKQQSALHGSYDLIPSQSQAQAPPEVRYAEPSTKPAPPPARKVEDQKPRGPQGVITVPSAGLRLNPSLDSKPMKGPVRNNEKITILKRKSSSAGPDWLQIETRSGRVGWVWASVVREVRRGK